MASAANIVLADSTPANHTFTPMQASPELTLHIENGVATTAPGCLNFTSSHSVATSKRPTDRVQFRFNYPVEQTVDGVTSVAYIGRAIVDVIIPSQMTNTERLHFGAYVKNLLANSVIQGYFSRVVQY